MKEKCCRSAPRCASCPVLAVAAARRSAGGRDPSAVLVAAILGGSHRELPGCVHDALTQLDEARLAAARVETSQLLAYAPDARLTLVAG